MTRINTWAILLVAAALSLPLAACKDTKTLQENEQLKTQLAELQKAIQTATQEFTREPSEDRFSGHVTLGRIKEIGRPDAHALVHAASLMGNELFVEWGATGVELMKSELDEAGAKHLTLAQIPFAS